jgi:putative Holliday junction resolvase
VTSILAFDYGTKNIGVAVGQTLTRTAQSVGILKARDGIPEWSQIEKVLKEWAPDIVIVGLPLNMDESESELSARARKFANRLNGRFGVKVELVDERLSSFEAKGEVMSEGGSRHYKSAPVDAIAARIILQSYLDQLP